MKTLLIASHVRAIATLFGVVPIGTATCRQQQSSAKPERTSAATDVAAGETPAAKQSEACSPLQVRQSCIDALGSSAVDWLALMRTR